MNDERKGLAAFNMISDAIKSRDMVVRLAKNDFKTKYAGSFLGIVWAFVQPVVTILLYWFVFSIGFRSGNVGDYPFVLWLTAGLVPWFFFQDAWNGATTSMIEYNFLVKKVVFNVGILPVIKVIAALFVNAFFTVFAIFMFTVMGYFPGIHIIQLVYVLFCIIALALALSYITSAVVVFIRDVSHFLTVFLQMLMWLTPIMWNISMTDGIPWLKFLLHANPVFYIVQCYRDAMFGGKWFFEHGWWTLYFWAFTLIFMIIGGHVFKKLRPHFADVL
ncbi:MAG: ABC transporter permease [Lachnospiraceae bacterium]|nr:ABC transporter permease [Lachnospiraceae bacterium]